MLEDGLGSGRLKVSDSPLVSDDGLRRFFLNENALHFTPAEDGVVARGNRVHDTILGARANYHQVLGDVGLEITENGAFKRLYGIAHFGMRYPSHSRGEHSMNAACVASILSQKSPDMGYSQEALKLAALLHDVGHYAFSHTAEMVNRDVFDHKERGRELIVDSPISKLIKKAGEKPEVVADIALEKFKGNIFSMPRAARFISVDHVSNLMGNLYFGGPGPKRLMTRELAWEMLQRIYISRDGLVSFGKEKNSVAMAQKMTRLSIVDNLQNIFSPRSIMIDMVTTDLFRDLIDDNILTYEDFVRTDDYVLFKIRGALEKGLASDSVQQKIIAWQALLDEKVVDDEMVEAMLKEFNSIEDKLKHGKNHMFHKIHDHYILAPAVDGRHPTQDSKALKREVEVAAEKITKPIFALDRASIERISEHAKRRAREMISG